MATSFAVAALTPAAPAGWRPAAANVCLPGVRRRRVPRGLRCGAAQGGPKVPAKLAELWATARNEHPLAVLAAAAAAFAIYKVASGLLAPPPPPPRRREEGQAMPPPPVPEPVEVGEVTEEELRQYDGSDPEKPLLMAIKGQIYDVSQSRLLSLSPGL
uniref:Cytochrome b5 heme-binding domain-containing protein n=1 Tax=Arundo donax TaxID=35708 RepID=A0A0A9CI27_ARUDO